MTTAKKPKQKSRPGWRAVYDDFLQNFTIDSKEYGRTKLELWGTQKYVLDEIAIGMEEGVKFFVIPKGRQYGITTALIPLDVLWMLTHPGIEGAFIGHKQDVIEVARAQVNDIQTRLPASHKVELKTNNKDRIEWRFPDGTISTLNLLVAGTTERKTDLAKGHGLTIIHGSECGEWGSETAFNSMLASLAEQHPDRLYIFESTGEGANNLFARLTRKSIDHPARRVIFPPWWLHDLYKLDRRSKLYTHYMANPEPTDDEAEIIRAAKERGHELTDAQLAWYRKKSDEQTTISDMRKNYPSVLEDCFQLGGQSFIPNKPLRFAKDAAEAVTLDAYSVSVGATVSEMKIKLLGKGITEGDPRCSGADLRVWAEPKARGTYCVGVFPSDQEGELAAVQVIRCFADGVEQVAEFSSDSIEPYHLAWVTAYLTGWYRNCWLNAELANGGRAMFREMIALRNQVSMGIIGDENIFGAMIFYLYNKIDNLSGGSRTWMWETNGNNEREIFVDFKDSFLVNRIAVHSVPMLEEMGSIINQDNYIGGDDGSDDARTRALCIAFRTYVDHLRVGMIANRKTRETEMKADVGGGEATFLENLMSKFMRRQEDAVRGR